MTIPNRGQVRRTIQGALLVLGVTLGAVGGALWFIWNLGKNKWWVRVIAIGIIFLLGVLAGWWGWTWVHAGMICK